MVKLLLGALLLAVSASAYHAPAAQRVPESVWLSDVRPGTEADGTAMMARHGGPAGFKVWVVSGDPAKGGACVRRADGAAAAYGNAGERLGADAAVIRGCAAVKATAAGSGRYTVYYTTQTVRDGVRYVDAAKFDTDYGRHGDKVALRDTSAAHLPFEIVRLYAGDDELFSHFHAGDTLTFKTLFNGRPKAGVQLVMTAGDGWSKTAVSGSDGSVSFTLINSYFPAWDKFDKRHRDNFVLLASVTQAEAGNEGNASYASTRYRTTYTGAFYPQLESYLSYAYGLLFATGALLLTFVIVYRYRKRREKQFAEVRFDEKA